jgi:hypothetical protein
MGVFICGWGTKFAKETQNGQKTASIVTPPFDKTG